MMRKTTTNDNDNENDNENYDNDNDNDNMLTIEIKNIIYIIKITKEKYFKDLAFKAHLDSAWIHAMKLSHTDSSPQILIPIPASLQFYQASSLQFG